jgi:hypothetical protein
LEPVPVNRSRRASPHLLCSLVARYQLRICNGEMTWELMITETNK